MKMDKEMEGLLFGFKFCAMKNLQTGRVIIIMLKMMMMTLSRSIRNFFYCLHLLDWPHCVYVCVCVSVCVCVCFVC